MKHHYWMGDVDQLEQLGYLDQAEELRVEMRRREEDLAIIHRTAKKKGNAWIMKGDNNHAYDPVLMNRHTYVGACIGLSSKEAFPVNLVSNSKP